jgi:serine/threonine protein kinase
VHSRSFSYFTDKSRGRASSDSESSHISLLEYAGATDADGELESVSTFESGSDASASDSDGTYDETTVYSEFTKFPTVLLFQEKMDGIMDKILDEEDPDFEEKWTAWTFQVIAALCVAQATFGLTHNDLHTNNILYSDTEEKYVYYSTRDGSTWKVPTYGRILRIIDYGRSAFRIGSQWFVSDDFAKGGDAEAQYSFGEFKAGADDVYPNPSFDLSRYAVSIMEPLFPTFPASKEGGEVINREGSWVIKESVSPLWNLLWTWLIDDKGENILRNEDGTERFPDFDLYEKIAAHVFTAKPQEQVRKDIFKQYSVTGVPVGQKVYSLFC